MSSEWRLMTLKEAGVSLIDCDHRTPAALDEGYPYIAIPQLKNGHITLEGVRRISREDYIEWTKKLKPQANDVIVVRRCNSGQSAHIPAGLDCAIGQNLVVLRANGEYVLPEFLRWVVQGPEWWGQVSKFINVGAVFDSLRCRDIPSFEMVIPPRVDQAEIASLLGALDARITLLRETNATLEGIAQALFKSWFVDFDPVRAKAEGRQPEGMDAPTAALFPNSFEDSALGLVPKGWGVTACKNIMDVRDGTHESPKPSLSGHPLITSRHITSGEVITDDAYLIASEDYLSISKRSKVDRLDVLITMIGTVGVPAIVLDDAPEYAIKNIGLFKSSASPLLSHYMYILLCSAGMQQYLLARLAGTTQKYLSLKALREILVLVPSESVLEEFSRVISPLFEKIHQQRSQIKSLTKLRDTLLPRLISGQLRLPDAEQTVAEVLV